MQSRSVYSKEQKKIMDAALLKEAKQGNTKAVSKLLKFFPVTDKKKQAFKLLRKHHSLSEKRLVCAETQQEAGDLFVAPLVGTFFQLITEKICLPLKTSKSDVSCRKQFYNKTTESSFFCHMHPESLSNTMLDLISINVPDLKNVKTESFIMDIALERVYAKGNKTQELLNSLLNKIVILEPKFQEMNITNPNEAELVSDQIKLAKLIIEFRLQHPNLLFDLTNTINKPSKNSYTPKISSKINGDIFTILYASSFLNKDYEKSLIDKFCQLELQKPTEKQKTLESVYLVELQNILKQLGVPGLHNLPEQVKLGDLAGICTPAPTCDINLEIQCRSHAFINFTDHLQRLHSTGCQPRDFKQARQYINRLIPKYQPIPKLNFLWTGIEGFGVSGLIMLTKHLLIGKTNLKPSGVINVCYFAPKLFNIALSIFRNRWINFLCISANTALDFLIKYFIPKKFLYIPQIILSYTITLAAMYLQEQNPIGTVCFLGGNFLADMAERAYIYNKVNETAVAVNKLFIEKLKPKLKCLLLVRKVDLEQKQKIKNYISRAEKFLKKSIENPTISLYASLCELRHDIKRVLQEITLQEDKLIGNPDDGYQVRRLNAR